MSWAIEWSWKQRAPHKELLEDYISDCRRKALEKIDQEWILIGVYESYDEATEALDLFWDLYNKAHKEPIDNR